MHWLLTTAILISLFHTSLGIHRRLPPSNIVWESYQQQAAYPVIIHARYRWERAEYFSQMHVLLRGTGGYSCFTKLGRQRAAAIEERRLSITSREQSSARLKVYRNTVCITMRRRVMRVVF